jgi:hypothetical protein
VGNEENECPVPEPNKTMRNITNELNYAHKNKSLKVEIVDEITVKLMEKLQEAMVNQKVQDILKK